MDLDTGSQLVPLFWEVFGILRRYSLVEKVCHWGRL